MKRRPMKTEDASEAFEAESVMLRSFSRKVAIKIRLHK
jgi:hypothetical protein